MNSLTNVINRLKINEGYRSKVYKCSLGYDTIGYGFAIKDLELTEEISTIILTQLVEKKHNFLQTKLIWYDEMPTEIQGVIIEMVYQIGYTGFTKFKKAIKHMKNKNFVNASKEMLDSKWAKNDSPQRAKRLAKIVENYG